MSRVHNKLARLRTIIGCLAISASAAAVAPSQEESSGARSHLREAAGLIVKATNALRADDELPGYAENASLQKAADRFARFLAEAEEFSHTADGQEPIDRARENGYEPQTIAENIAWQQSSRPLKAQDLAERFMEGWKQSEDHRRNMLEPDMTEIGVAIAYNDKTNQYYAVQMFGRPQPPKPASDR
jgi:uncharacterized protein YkwD